MSALDAALAEAALLDASDPLRSLRASFLLPQHRGTDAVYLCGHSLGAQPRAVQEHVARQLDKWGAQAVEGHFSEPTPWLTMDDTVQASMARVVGSKPSEVVLMNSLTCNLHLMMAAFYAPSQRRVKILIEKKAFPSDVHAVVSQIRHHKLDPVDALVELEPRTGETHLRAEDIEQCIAALGDSLALVMFAGVQYFTGQVFPLARITAAAHAVGALAGFDLAHAVGNVPLALHDWECDFACWCTYKYLNCGPGGIGGCFVHERHSLTRDSRPHLAGWWGHRLSDRFDMGPAFEPCEGAYGYRLSNPPVLLLACARASLDLFDQVRTSAKLGVSHIAARCRRAWTPSAPSPCCSPGCSSAC